jgi:pyruvate dehydrogenase (quinone)
VISLPGDVAAADAPARSLRVALPAAFPGPASASDLAAMAALIDEAQTVAIFGGDGCSEAQAEVRALAGKLNAPVGYTLKGKQWLEHDNPNAVGMTGLLGYGGCWGAINHADVLLMLGTDFPFPKFLPRKDVKTIQVDRNPAHLGRRAPLELGVAGDVQATLGELLPLGRGEIQRYIPAQVHGGDRALPPDAAALRHQGSWHQADPARVPCCAPQRAGR